MSRPRIVVFYGGTAGNRDLSAETGRWVCQYLPRETFDVTPVEVTADGKWKVPLGNLPRTGPIQRTMHMLSEAVPALSPRKALERLLFRPAHGFLTLLRGKGGDDGSLHSLAEMLDVQMIGSPQRTCQITSDKFLFSQAVDPIAPVPYSEPLWTNKDADSVLSRVRDHFLPPFFVKNSREEGSSGIHYVESTENLFKVLQENPLDDLFLQEKAMGTEFSMTLVQDGQGKLVTLPPTVVVLHKADFYDHLAKRRPGRVRLHTQDMRENPVIREAENVARDVYEQLGCKGVATIDMVADGRFIQLLEVNTVPTLSITTPLAHQLKSSGLHPTRMLDYMVRQALG